MKKCMLKNMRAALRLVKCLSNVKLEFKDSVYKYMKTVENHLKMSHQAD